MAIKRISNRVSFYLENRLFMRSSSLENFVQPDQLHKLFHPVFFKAHPVKSSVDQKFTKFAKFFSLLIMGELRSMF
jgi:hypothetical protein